MVDDELPGTFSQSDPYVGYEGYLSYNDKFAYSVQDTRTIGDDNGIGSVSFYYLDSGRSYYAKVRSYTIRNNVKSLDCGEIRKVDLPIYDTKGTTPAKYTLGNLWSGQAEKQIFTQCIKPLYKNRQSGSKFF